MKRRETELYEPVKAHFESLGFTVRGEVHHCDLAAIRGDDTVVVELKTTFTLELVLQGIERQKTADWVYLAVEAPKNRRASHWRDIMALCRRLELGLMMVAFRNNEPRVDILCDPDESKPRKSQRRRNMALRTELLARSGDYSPGGSTRRPIVTAYREQALRIADFIRNHGTVSPEQLRREMGAAKAASILQGNFYGWFVREGRGRYNLSPLGLAALDQYQAVLSGHMREEESGG